MSLSLLVFLACVHAPPAPGAGSAALPPVVPLACAATPAASEVFSTDALLTLVEAHTAAEGGATVDVGRGVFVSPGAAFAVSRAGGDGVAWDADLRGTLVRFVAEHADDWARGDCLGTWRDDVGVTWVDRTVILPYGVGDRERVLDAALRLAASEDQAGIYDFGRREVVPVPGLTPQELIQPHP